jgi:hypothetical protein
LKTLDKGYVLLVFKGDYTSLPKTKVMWGVGSLGITVMESWICWCECANPLVVDQFAAVLQTTSEEGIGLSTNQQTLYISE